MNKIKRLLAITLVVVALAVTSSTHLPLTGANVAAQGNCHTICFRSPAQWATIFAGNPFLIPRGPIIIPLDNGGNPVFTFFNFKSQLILFILKPLGTLGVPTNPFLRLRALFVAVQLSLPAQGFGKLAEPAIFNSALSCYGLTFAPITLSNGVVITTSTSLGVLLLQAEIALSTNQAADMTALAPIFDQLTVGNCARF